MKSLFIVCVAIVALAQSVTAQVSGICVAIDFEEQPRLDLSSINNVYHGGTEYVYAFLVISAPEGFSGESSVGAYDIGYRLISPDRSVVNRGFYRLPGWNYLDAADLTFPGEAERAESSLPTSIGYWKLELKKGRRSRGEFQIVPNPINQRSAVTVVGKDSQTIDIPDEDLSQDIRCQGLINRTFYFNEPYPYDLADIRYMPGEVIARFMPGVIEMDGRNGGINDIVDPGLRRIADDYRLV